MKYYPDAPLVMSNQQSAIETYGDGIWEHICNKCICGKSYHIDDILGDVPEMQHLADRTQKDYIRAVLKNVWWEQETIPDHSRPLKFLHRDVFILR